MDGRPSTRGTDFTDDSEATRTTAHEGAAAAAGPRATERLARRLENADATGVLDLADPREPSSLRFALDEVPAGLPAGLRELWLTNNRVALVAPAALPSATLTTLALGGNLLRALPPEIRLLAGLERLLLDGNLLEAVPEELAELQELRELRLDRNRLRRFPAPITRCRALQRLGLSHNKLTAVPPEVRRLTNLAELDLDFNELGPDVPPELGRLHGLRVLGLAHNQLEAFPEALRLLRLDMLRIAGNRRAGLPVLDPLSQLPVQGQVIPLRKDGFFRYVERPTPPLGAPKSSEPPAWAPLEGLVPYEETNEDCAEWVRDDWNDARAVLRARAKNLEWRTENRLKPERRRKGL